jgi:ABC-type uncharacterized transport system permease subunit
MNTVLTSALTCSATGVLGATIANLVLFEPSSPSPLATFCTIVAGGAAGFLVGLVVGYLERRRG